MKYLCFSLLFLTCFLPSLSNACPVEGCSFPPYAEFTYTKNQSNKLELTFDGSSSYDEFGDIVEYKWDFGDGVVEVAGSEIVHEYATKGAYTAKLLVSNTEGLESEFEVKVQAGFDLVEVLIQNLMMPCVRLFDQISGDVILQDGAETNVSCGTTLSPGQLRFKVPDVVDPGEIPNRVYFEAYGDFSNNFALSSVYVVLPILASQVYRLVPISIGGGNLRPKLQLCTGGISDNLCEDIEPIGPPPE